MQITIALFKVKEIICESKIRESQFGKELYNYKLGFAHL